MSNAAEILVIILSIVLALFLVLSITLTIMLIKVTKQIRAVADNARTVSEHVANIAGNAARFSSPALISKFVFEQIKKYRK